MNRESRSLGATAFIVVVVLVVLLCASLGVAFMGEHMGPTAHAALFCCFIVAVTLVLVSLARPKDGIVLSTADREQQSRRLSAHLPPPKPPDPVTLGILLI